MSDLHIGGQAVIEGVMIRGKTNWVIAVRRPSKEIVIEERKINSLGKKYPILTKFVLRGMLAFVEALSLGFQALNFSAKEAMEGEFEEEMGLKEMIFVFGMAAVLIIGLFFIMPAYLSSLLDGYISSTILSNIIEGLIRIAIFVSYLFVVSRLKDIRRVFEYHGAEHKVINAYEAGEELTPESAEKYSTLHVRCGTAFVLIVMIVLIIVFAFLGRPSILMRVVSRLVIIPLVTGVSYEIIKFSSKYENSYFVKIITWPGLMLQRLTTREPSKEQLEVAISSVKRLLELENSKQE
ncbi:MAG: DUF1385 domain-containing protein [Actinobacteria bacterium]|nr:DUF1385 domain-containing protein [Actinomycetota bacterium]